LQQFLSKHQTFNLTPFVSQSPAFFSHYPLSISIESGYSLT